jgi:hypothetical protein
MKQLCLHKLHYLLLPVLLMAMTGCGANSSALNGANGGSGSVTAKLVIGKGAAAKAVANALPAGIASLQFTVTGSDANGNAIPVVRNTITTTDSNGQGTVTGIYPGQVTVAVKALAANNTVVYEGFAINVTVAAGPTPANAGTIVLSAPLTKPQDANCVACHETTLDVNGQNLVADFKQSGHYMNLSWTANPRSDNGVVTTGAGCAGCHGPSHNDVNPATSGRCYECHGGNFYPSHLGNAVAIQNNNCNNCHQPHNTTQFVQGTCVACHAVGQDATASGSFVDDNSGVRAITAEFSKRSHHITGGSPKDEQCAVCHLEGKVVNGIVMVDSAYHMKGAAIYLRNADTDAAFVWSGTEHTNMDNFCFSCHDSNGATSAGIAAIMTGKNFGGPFSPTNPFADTLTNGYDQVARAGVVDVKTAFTTSNASHHAVSGQRYKYRFSTAANALVWFNRDPAHRTMPAASEIAEGHTDLDGNAIDAAADFGETMTGDYSLGGQLTPLTTPKNGTTGSNFTAKGEGESTLYEAEKFVGTYVPLGASNTVADNSTLHCGDCHTVGQWKAGSTTNADGSATTVAIGAHGSANEYLLRNSLGTDALHNNLTYVCFNCHKAGLAAGNWFAAPTLGFGVLHPVQNKNQVMGYATAHAISAFHIQCLADSANNIGATDRLSKSWEGDKTTLDYAPAVVGGAALPAGGSDANYGNITGIACTNCHNSGLRSSFGGIHGGDNTYTDGLGRTQKSYRFMPGMGNYRYAPPGGWDGKDVSNPKFVTVAGNAAGIAGGKPMGGCYTNGAVDTNPGYSSCNHHGTSTTPVYGGGTTGVGNGDGTNGAGDTSKTSATWEPTVREATAGNALVTRPLKY